MTIAIDVDDRQSVYRCTACGAVLTLAHTVPARPGEVFIAAHRVCAMSVREPGADGGCGARRPGDG